MAFLFSDVGLMDYGSNAAWVDFWNSYAPWYRRWRTHNDYHRPILEELRAMVRPGWRVLDIGAADGPLTLPLAEWGCRVTALEPAAPFREDLDAAVRRSGIPGLLIMGKTWEEFSDRQGESFDLVLACNSLHLAAGGFRKSLAKVFKMRPRRVLVVTEVEASGLFNLNQPGYSLDGFQTYETDSHFAYHDPSEVEAHWEVCYGIRPSPEERSLLFRRLCRDGGHWWLKARVTVRMFYYEKNENRISNAEFRMSK